MIFITGDDHFDHFSVIPYTGRPFQCLGYMNVELVRRWNEVVSDDDLVIHLGDFCFNKRGRGHVYWDRQLKGRKIFLQGNHDNHRDAPIQSLIFKYGGIDWWCSHYPETRYKHNLCAHVHNLWRVRKDAMSVVVNCGVDVHNYAPVSMDEVMRIAMDAPMGESI